MDDEMKTPPEPPANAYNQLSPRHQLIIDSLAEGATQAKAGIKAGFSERSASSSVSRLMKNAEIRESLEERQAQLAIASHYTRLEMVSDLMRTRDLALASNQPGAAVSAIKLLGQLNGLLKEELTVTHQGDALTCMSQLITRFTESAIGGQSRRKGLPNSKAVMVDHGEWLKSRPGPGQNGDQATTDRGVFGGAGLVDPPSSEPEPGPSEE